MPAKHGRNISLTDEQDALIDRLLESGRYASASEVVRDGLRLLERDEESRLLEKWLIEGLTGEEEARMSPDLLGKFRSSVQAKIREGLEALDRGDVVDGDEFFATWRQRIKSAEATKTSQSPLKRRA